MFDCPMANIRTFWHNIQYTPVGLTLGALLQFNFTIFYYRILVSYFAVYLFNYPTTTFLIAPCEGNLRCLIVFLDPSDRVMIMTRRS